MFVAVVKPVARGLREVCVSILRVVLRSVIQLFGLVLEVTQEVIQPEPIAVLPVVGAVGIGDLFKLSLAYWLFSRGRWWETMFVIAVVVYCSF
jgi:hypothetical protein